MQMKTIQIDFDVHRLIELERSGFDESENAALRRLLKLPDQTPTNESEISRTPITSENSGLPWSGKGIVLPHGTELRMEYRGQLIRGRIENAKWSVDGATFTSPSDAAGSSARTKDGERPSLNGWIYWEVKRPTDATWRRLSSLKGK